MVAACDATLEDLVADLLAEAGPSHYARVDLRLSRPVVKARMVQDLVQAAPKDIEGVAVSEVVTLDGVKYLLEDESWLLIRPSGTEPVLRVYAEAPSPERVEALLRFGRGLAAPAA